MPNKIKHHFKDTPYMQRPEWQIAEWHKYPGDEGWTRRAAREFTGDPLVRWRREWDMTLWDLELRKHGIHMGYTHKLRSKFGDSNV